MKQFLTPLALVLLGSGHEGDTRLAFTPEEGTTLTRSFEAHARYFLVGQSVTANDEVFEADEVPDFSIDSLESISVTDTLVSVEDGRVTEFQRTFDDLSQTSEYDFGGDETKDSESVSDLEGRRVRFTWDEDGEFYGVEADDDGEPLDDSVTEWLLADLDLQHLLPEEEVAEGDTWDGDPRAYLVMMWPGGLLDFYEEGEDPSPDYQREMNQEIIENLDGECTVTFAGIRKEEGVRVAVLEVEFDLRSESDGEETTTEEFLDEDGDTTEVEIEKVHAVELRRVLAGTVLWNLEGNHLHSLSVEADIEMDSHVTSKAESPDGREFEVKESMSYEGSITYTATVEVE